MGPDVPGMGRESTRRGCCSKIWHQSRYRLQNSETLHRILVHDDARFAQSLQCQLKGIPDRATGGETGWIDGRAF